MKAEVDIDRFRFALTSWMIDRGLKTRDLAKKSGCSTSMIDYIMAARKEGRKIPGLDTIVKIARALDITVDELLHGKNGEGLKKDA